MYNSKAIKLLLIKHLGTMETLIVQVSESFLMDDVHAKV